MFGWSPPQESGWRRAEEEERARYDDNGMTVLWNPEGLEFLAKFQRANISSRSDLPSPGRSSSRTTHANKRGAHAAGLDSPGMVPGRGGGPGSSASTSRISTGSRADGRPGDIHETPTNNDTSHRLSKRRRRLNFRARTPLNGGHGDQSDTPPSSSSASQQSSLDPETISKLTQLAARLQRRNMGMGAKSAGASRDTNAERTVLGEKNGSEAVKAGSKVERKENGNDVEVKSVGVTSGLRCETSSERIMLFALVLKSF